MISNIYNIYNNSQTQLANTLAFYDLHRCVMLKTHFVAVAMIVNVKTETNIILLFHSFTLARKHSWLVWSPFTICIRCVMVKTLKRSLSLPLLLSLSDALNLLPLLLLLPLHNAAKLFLLENKYDKYLFTFLIF